MSYIATIKLRKGCTSFFDGENSIYLSSRYETADIDSSYNLTTIKRAIKNGKIMVVKGKIFFNNENINYVFEPKFYGVKNKTISVGTNFNKMEGVLVMADNIDITNSVSIEGLVNTNVPGVYLLEYTVSDKAGNKAAVERKITVVDTTAPTIAGIDDSTIPYGSTFAALDGVIVTDIVDGTIDNSNVKITITDSTNVLIPAIDTTKPGEYSISYSVSDKANNVALKVRKITVEEKKDTEAPVFSGTEDKTVEAGSTFNPLDEVKATDDVDGDVTSNIQVALK